MKVLWSQKVKHGSNKNKERITNKIWDGKKRVDGGSVFSFYPRVLGPWMY